MNLLVQTQITIYWQTINFRDMVNRCPLPKVFLIIIKYTVRRPENTTVIVNQDVWNRTRAKERSKIGIMQRFQDSVIVNNKITMYTAIRALKETDSLTKYATHIREFRIPKKYLVKLRK